MTGRPPKPTAIKNLEGNPGKRATNPDEAAPEPKLPPAPRHLGKEGRAEWRRTGKKLLALGLVTEIDKAGFAAYCQLWERWVEAETMLREYGMVITTKNGNLVQSPYLNIANRCLVSMRLYLVQFGMSPASRAKATAAKQTVEDDRDDLIPGRRRAG